MVFSLVWAFSETGFVGSTSLDSKYAFIAS
jgi:hypothetical protein